MGNCGKEDGTEERRLLDASRKEEFEVSAGRMEDPSHYYILVNLPEDVKKETVKIQVSKSHITVSGERRVNQHRLIPFHHTFNSPEDSDTAKVTGQFRDELVYSIKIPKQRRVKQETTEPRKEDNGGEKKFEESSDRSQDLNEEEAEPCARQRGGLGSLLGVFGTKMGFVFNAAFWFSLGVFVSRKFDTSGKRRER